jgi:hypothetical protein
MKELEKTIDEIFEQSIQEWIAQGRSEEEIHGVRNFFTGRGIEAKADILTAFNKELVRELEAIEEFNSSIGEGLPWDMGTGKYIEGRKIQVESLQSGGNNSVDKEE